MKTLDEMIREYRIELYKACDGRIGLQAWKYKGKPGAEEEIRANKDALVAELVRRERKRKTNEERKHRERILNLQKEHPANLPDLNVGDLVAWFDILPRMNAGDSRISRFGFLFATTRQEGRGR